VEASLEVYARGRALAEAAGARRTLAKLQHDEASSLRRLRRLDEAQQLLLPAIAFYRASGDLRLEALARQTLAAVMRARGQVDEALRLGDAAIAVARRAGDPFSLSEAVAAHGNALTQVGRPADARRFLEEAVALQRTIGNVIGLSFTLGNLGAVLEHLDEPLEAELVTGEALQVADEAGVPYAAAFWRYRLAQLAHQRDAVQEACDGYRAAIERLDAQQAVPQIHHAQACAATAEAERGDLDAADALLGRAAPLARGNPLDRTVLTLCDAAVARWAGRPTPEGVDEALVFARSEALLEPVVRMHDRSPAGDQGV
jgi:tetratricopeptide (TPR) repeat protein